MRSVRSRDTGPEMRLRRALWAAGLRYRLGLRVAGVRPDLAFVNKRIAVFVDGCFWHGCPRHYGLPRSNSDFWRRKLEKNQERDRRNDRELAAAGWTVLRFWSCEIRDDLDRVVDEIRSRVRGKRPN